MASACIWKAKTLCVNLRCEICEWDEACVACRNCGARVCTGCYHNEGFTEQQRDSIARTVSEIIGTDRLSDDVKKISEKYDPRLGLCRDCVINKRFIL